MRSRSRADHGRPDRSDAATFSSSRVGGIFGSVRYALAAGAVAVGMLAFPASAFAQPVNDAFSSATVINGLPFSDTVDTSGAATDPGEPQNCALMYQTVWYAFTPATTMVLRANVSAGIGASVNIYRADGPGLGGLSFVNCAINPAPFGALFTAQAGTTYYLQAGGDYGSVGNIQVTLEQVPAPPNDNFASATAVGSLPFTDSVDSTAATTEPNEPAPPCGYGAAAGTVWYAFTPTASGSVSATSSAPFFSTAVAAYTGSSPASLTSLGCRAFGSPLTIHVDPGTTYYFQVGGLFGGQGPSMSFTLAVTPPPTAQFGFFPSDPSIFDSVQFDDFSSDPGGLGIQSEVWSFGDGTTATGCCPTHRFAADADYTVKLTVTTPDGRSSSTSQVVHVKTHDVAITKLVVPQAAHPGQTRSLVAGISDPRYPETVQVQLFKSVPGGFQQVGTLTQSVPVLSGNRTTPFSFNYTFTSDDQVAGKVTFEAVATIIGARDAQPADNTVVALPTVVN